MLPDTEWLDEAICKGAGTTFFYERPLPIDEDGARTIDVEAVDEARTMCDVCPVRGQCFEQVMREESGKAITNRDGVYAGMTPHQRHSAEKRRAVECPVCGAMLDPALVRAGIVRCPVNARHVSRTSVPIPEDGDGWTKRHTGLARRVVQHLDDTDESVRRPQTLAREWGERPTDMARVYEALVMDGTLKRTSKGYERARRAHAHREEPSSWLPMHLRGAP
jgi:hypothetical protein